MSEPRKPIFGFLWAKPDPDAPVDAAYHQTRRVRVAARGPIRLVLLVVGTLVVASTAGSAVLAGLSTGSITASFAAAAIIGFALVLVLRGWVVGTYVTDDAVSVDRVFSRTTIGWPQVAAVLVVDGRRGFLGLPVTAAAREVVLELVDGSRQHTHLYSTSPDLWLRAESFDIAALRLQRWLPAE